MKTNLAILLFVVLAAVIVWFQFRTQSQLRAANESLQQQIAQLQTDNENYSKRLSEVGDSKKLSNEQFSELLKLRGEVGTLHRQLDELAKLRKENQQLREAEAKFQVSNETIEMNSAFAKFKANEIQVVNTLKQLALAERIYAGDNNDQYATNFDQMANELGGLYKNPLLDNVEFVNVGIVNEQYPQMILFRERVTRQAPDGIWHLVYGLADGSVQVATSRDGNFDPWQKYDESQKGIIFLPQP